MYENIQRHPESSQFARPIGSSISPFATRDPGSTFYVMYKLSEARTRPTRVLISRSGPRPGWRIGTHFDLYHGTTGNSLGEYMVVGILDSDSGELTGDVPDRAIKAAALT